MGILNRFKKGSDKDLKKKEELVLPQNQKPATIIKAVSTSGKKTEILELKTAGSDIIIRPLVTEKSAVLASNNMYVFVIDKTANRIQVRSAIKEMYGVIPVSVNIQNVRGKRVRFGRRSGKRKDWKKAIITLPKGKSINVYEGV